MTHFLEEMPIWDPQKPILETKAIKKENKTDHKFITQITKQSIRYFYEYIVENRPEIIEQT